MEFLRAAFVLFLSILLVQGFPKNGPVNNILDGQPDHLEVTNITQKENHLGNAHIADEGQFPWHVAIFVYNFTSKFKHVEYTCGGSIISENWILTAAHCLQPGHQYVVSYGTTEIELEFDMINDDSSKNISKAIHFTDAYFYHDYSKYYDAALLRTKSPIKFTDKVKPIPLANKDIGDLVGKEIVISGYGRVKTDGPLTDKLQFGRFQEINYFECPEDFMCTKALDNESTFTCNGDSGGPVVYEESPKKWVLVGVVSGGSNDGCELYPQFQLRVSSILDWIEKISGLRP